MYDSDARFDAVFLTDTQMQLLPDTPAKFKPVIVYPCEIYYGSKYALFLWEFSTSLVNKLLLLN